MIVLSLLFKLINIAFIFFYEFQIILIGDQLKLSRCSLPDVNLGRKEVLSNVPFLIFMNGWDSKDG